MPSRSSRLTSWHFDGNAIGVVISTAAVVAVAPGEQTKPPQPGRGPMHFPQKSAVSLAASPLRRHGTREEAAMPALMSLMSLTLLAAMAPALGASAPARDTFALQAQLQSLYDEDSA